MKIGDVVVCVNDNGLSGKYSLYPGLLIPTRKNEYTIREIMTGETGLIGLRFEELRNGKYDKLGFEEPAFLINRFRKKQSHSFTNEVTEELANKVEEFQECELIQ